MGEVAERWQLRSPQLDQVEELALDFDLVGDHPPGFPEPGSEAWAASPPTLRWRLRRWGRARPRRACGGRKLGDPKRR